MSSLAEVVESHRPPKGEGRGVGLGGKVASEPILPGPLSCSLALSILGGRPAPALHPCACWEGLQACPAGRGGMTAVIRKCSLSVHVALQRGEAALTLGN